MRLDHGIGGSDSVHFHAQITMGEFRTATNNSKSYASREELVYEVVFQLLYSPFSSLHKDMDSSPLFTESEMVVSKTSSLPGPAPEWGGAPYRAYLDCTRRSSESSRRPTLKFYGGRRVLGITATGYSAKQKGLSFDNPF